VQRGLLAPAVVPPSGHYRWDLDHVRDQLRALCERGDDD
jgi:hypothetical protein